VLGSDLDDRIVIRNTTAKPFDNVTVSVAGEETLYGKSTPVFGFRAFVDRLDADDDVDLTGRLMKADGTQWSRLTMKMTNVNVEAAKVCESGFVQRRPRH
jgi:hypothetical protein